MDLEADAATITAALETKPTRKLNICMVIDAYDTSLAGVCISTQRFVKALRKEHKVTVISTGAPGEDKVVLPSFSPPIFGKTMPFKLAIPKVKVLRETIRHTDLVHIQLPTWLGRMAIKVAKELGVPRISSMHRQPENFLLPMGISWQRSIDWFYNFEVKNFYNQCQHVICPSKFAERELLQYNLNSKTTVISNGVDPFFTPGPSTIRTMFRDEFIILTVGRLSKEKCQEIIIQATAASAYKDKILLVVIGRGELELELKTMATKLLGDRVLFLTSGISNETLLDYYRAADLYVHAGSVELECMTVLEAMACGKTPVISNAPKSAAGQFALDDRSLFYNRNIESLKQKIDYWISHPKELLTSNMRYLKEANEFSINSSAGKLKKIYQGVLIPKYQSQKQNIMFS